MVEEEEGNICGTSGQLEPEDGESRTRVQLEDKKRGPWETPEQEDEDLLQPRGKTTKGQETHVDLWTTEEEGDTTRGSCYLQQMFKDGQRRHE